MDPLVEALNDVLATGFAIYLKTHSAHWNVEGPLFPQLHALFERQYEDLHDAIDDYAEKIRQLDVYVDATLPTLANRSRVRGFADPTAARDMISSLLADHETMLVLLHEAIEAAETVEEEGIVSFLATRVEMHQKWRWFLRTMTKSV